MTKKTLVITSQQAQRKPNDELMGTLVNHTFVIRDEEEKLKKSIEKVLKGGRPVYLETEGKQVLVLTKALLENSVVYFAEDQ